MVLVVDVARAGRLIAPGPDVGSTLRRAALQVDKILRGVKPGDIPIEQLTRFQLVINMVTAKTLGLTLPPTLLLRAERVLE